MYRDFDREARCQFRLCECSAAASFVKDLTSVVSSVSDFAKLGTSRGRARLLLVDFSVHSKTWEMRIHCSQFDIKYYLQIFPSLRLVWPALITTFRKRHGFHSRTHCVCPSREPRSNTLRCWARLAPALPRSVVRGISGEVKESFVTWRVLAGFGNSRSG